jgi:Bacterial TniB protein
MELASATTPNQMLDQLLTTLGDTARVPSEAQRFKRACDISLDRGIELFLFDEVQHLISHDTARVAWRVTEAMKRLLNEGVAPIAFGGDLSATSLFRSNPQLRNRLLPPVELPPLDYSSTADTSYASIFFDHLDQRMVDERLVFTKANLGSGQIPSALCAASGGVIGTACNIVREALRIALKRNARKISAQDISDAIDTWAIPQGFAPSNPLYRWREAA